MTTVEDILEELRLPMPPAPAAAPAIALRGIEAAVYAQLTLDPQHMDVLVLRCRLPVAEVARVLLGLELRGLVQTLPGQRYVRATVEG